MQTHEWEALLDGTTPGPWGVNPEHCRAVVNLEIKFAVLMALDGESPGPENARLAAHAPAAVAEVIRLRKAIAELEAEERATADDEFFPVHLRDLCRAYADDLTRILNGDTDESP